MIQLEEFLGRLLSPLLKTGLPLMKSVIQLLTKSVLILLGLTAASAADAGTNKTLLGSGTTILIISNVEMKDIVKIVKSLDDFGLLLKRVSEITQNEVKEQKGGFLSMLLDTLGASLLGNMLADKVMNRAGERIIRAGYRYWRYKNIIKMNLDLMEFILEIIHLIK